MNWYSYGEFPVDTLVSVALFSSLGMLVTLDSVSCINNGGLQ